MATLVLMLALAAAWMFWRRTITVSMHFLPDVVMECNRCKGKRYTKSVLEILYKANRLPIFLLWRLLKHLIFLQRTQHCKRIKLMCDVGLDYLALGQSSTTLSGGEAQRIKLVDELAKRDQRHCIFLMNRLRDYMRMTLNVYLVFWAFIRKGNSLIVIEHNLDVLKVADYIIDLGQRRRQGWTIVAYGTPAKLLHAKRVTRENIKVVIITY